jgi:hypothetical protein
MNAAAKTQPQRVTRLLLPRPVVDRPRSAPQGGCGRSERLALFACALCRDTALDMLEGLCEPYRTRARRYAQQVTAWDSPSRQAKVAVEFGLREDAGRRLRAVMQEAAPALRLEMYRLLPPYLKTLFPELVAPSAAPSTVVAPGMAALAQRLVREATR